MSRRGTPFGIEGQFCLPEFPKARIEGQFRLPGLPEAIPAEVVSLYHERFSYIYHLIDCKKTNNPRKANTFHGFFI